MRRRITVIIVSVVAGALVVSGLVSLLLTSRSERRRAEADVTRQAADLAAIPDDASRVAQLANLSRVLKLDDLRLVGVTAARLGNELPAGLTEADIRPRDLAAG